MDLMLLDREFKSVDVIDIYESSIWTDRYNTYGDFELYIPASNKVMTEFQKEYYIWNSESEHMMIVEHVEIQSDTERGNYVVVTGRSLESILDRRIVWGQITLDGNLQNQIQKLLNDNIINPSMTKRKIENFIFEATDDPYITGLNINAQFTGDNLYDTITSICDNVDIGFKITLNSSNQFVFKLYYGTDRSYKQDTNPYVVFSPNFENIINSDYIDDIIPMKTVTLVGGEGEGSERKYLEVEKQELNGLDRREHFTDARDISSKVDDRTLSTAEYNALLKQRGEEKLAENVEVKSFDGEVEATQLYRYSEHFFMGDIVQIENEYGMESRARIVEFINSESNSGIKKYPTFVILEDA